MRNSAHRAVTRMSSKISDCEECKWLRAQLSSSEMQHSSRGHPPTTAPRRWLNRMQTLTSAVADARYIWWAALTPWLLNALGKSFLVTALSYMLSSEVLSFTWGETYVSVLRLCRPYSNACLCLCLWSVLSGGRDSGPSPSDSRHLWCRFLGLREFSAAFPKVSQLFLLPCPRGRRSLPVSERLEGIHFFGHCPSS